MEPHRAQLAERCVHPAHARGRRDRPQVRQRRREDEGRQVIVPHPLELGPLPAVLVVIAREVHPVRVRRVRRLLRQVLVELGCVVFAKAALQITGVLDDGVENTALLGQHGLLWFNGRGVPTAKKLHVLRATRTLLGPRASRAWSPHDRKANL